MDVWSTITTLILGGAGWLATSFAARPFMQFRELRSEVIQTSVLYANVAAAGKRNEHTGLVSNNELSEPEMDRLREAQAAFRDLAGRMRAFALNEPVAVWFVKWRYDPMKASAALLMVSNTLAVYGLERANAVQNLQQILRFRTE